MNVVNHINQVFELSFLFVASIVGRYACIGKDILR